MLDFFQMVGAYFSALFDVVRNIVLSLVSALSLAVSALNFTALLPGFLPPILGSAVLIFMAIVVVKFVIGR